MLKTQVKKIVSIACFTTLLLGTFAGCKGGGKTSSSESADTASFPKEHIAFKILCPSYGDDSMVAQGSVFQKLQKATNATITVQWTPSTTYTDKFNILMAGGNLPEAVVIPDLQSGVFTDAVADNQFWSIDSYLNSSLFPNFKTLNKTSITNTKTFGKSYVLPRGRVVKRQLVEYRADWAKKAGLGAPDTVEKVYEMAKNFASNDYDGNGKKDTVGLLLSTYSDGGGMLISQLPTLVVANGGFNKWGLKSGKVTSQYDTQEYLNTMTLLHKMYSEGLISSDFSITKSADQTTIMQKEQAGLCLSMGAPSATDALYVAKKKADSSLKVSDIYGYCFLKDSKGNDRIPGETGFNGGIAFPKSSVKNTTKLKQILSVWDYIQSKEGQTLVNIGIEGEEFSLNSDSTTTVIDSGKAKTLVADLNQLGLTGQSPYMAKPASSDDDLTVKQKKEQSSYKSGDLIYDVTTPLYSKTWSSKVNTLNKIIDEAQIKYIMGGTLDQFKAAIANWKSSGGDAAAKEFTNAYNGKSTYTKTSSSSASGSSSSSSSK